jgi:homoserine dehydrogenase
MTNPSIAIVGGTGLVGSELLRQIHASKQFKIVASTSSKLMTLGVDLSPSTKRTTPLSLPQLEAHALANLPCVIVDCTSSLEIASMYPGWMAAGLQVVTPNKKGFSSSTDLYREIKGSKTSLVRYEATVGYITRVC